MSRNIIVGENDLATTNPKLVLEWDMELNKLKPTEVTCGSQKKVFWKCGKCNNVWEADIKSRARGNGCPYCTGKRIAEGFNDLATTHPRVAKEWDFALNKPLKPNQVTAGARQKVWWKCSKCHNSWEATLAHRTSHNSSCPYCLGRKVAKGYNDLATTHPEIAKQWDFELNGDMTPEMFTFGSKKKFFWKCDKCNESYETSIVHRIQGCGCSTCASSKGEDKLRSILSNLDIKFKEQESFEGCKHKKQLKFDFTLYDRSESLLGCIEYDGEQHFRAIKSWGGEKKLQETQLRDSIKDTYCQTNNIPLLRISYIDFNQIQYLVEDFFTRVV